MRLQLALNVPDLNAAIDFYSRMFATGPAKIRPGYANFAITQPPLKLVLFENGEGTHLNHLGVECETPDEMELAARRLAGDPLLSEKRSAVNCCHSRQDKLWLTGPDELPWEWYRVLESAQDAA